MEYVGLFLSLGSFVFSGIQTYLTWVSISTGNDSPTTNSAIKIKNAKNVVLKKNKSIGMPLLDGDNIEGLELVKNKSKNTQNILLIGYLLLTIIALLMSYYFVASLAGNHR